MNGGLNHQPLSMYGSNSQGNTHNNAHSKSPKELPGIHGASNQNRNQSNNRAGGEESGDMQTLQNSYQYKKRNVSGNHRNIMSMHNSSVGAHYIHGG